jgi:hypothetical protein
MFTVTSVIITLLDHHAITKLYRTIVLDTLGYSLRLALVEDMEY